MHPGGGDRVTHPPGKEKPARTGDEKRERKHLDLGKQAPPHAAAPPDACPSTSQGSLRAGAQCIAKAVARDPYSNTPFKQLVSTGCGPRPVLSSGRTATGTARESTGTLTSDIDATAHTEPIHARGTASPHHLNNDMLTSCANSD